MGHAGLACRGGLCGRFLRYFGDHGLGANGVQGFVTIQRQSAKRRLRIAWRVRGVLLARRADQRPPFINFLPAR